MKRNIERSKSYRIPKKKIKKQYIEAQKDWFKKPPFHEYKEVHVKSIPPAKISTTKRVAVLCKSFLAVFFLVFFSKDFFA